jgi:hypothetical protein
MNSRREIKELIANLEKKISVTFPYSYIEFLSGIDDGELFEVNNTGKAFYSFSDLEERNQTYQIREYEPDYFMIGQDGDLGYFLNIKNNEDHSIYSNDLGAIGSLEMQKEASNIFDFIK